VDTAVWILAGIFALNALIVGGVAVYEVVDRVRADRQIATLEKLWRSPAAFATRAVERRGFGRRLAGATLATAVVAAGVLQANEGTRRVFTSALRVAVPVYPHDLEQRPAPQVIRSEPRTASAAGPDRRTHLAEGQATQPPATQGPGVATSDDPTVPATVAAVPRSPSSIEVLWQEVNGALGYSVERSDDGATDWNELTTTEAEVTRYVDGGLRSGTTYFYRISAETVDGTSPPSDIVAATTVIAPPEATFVVANATSPTTITLTWNDVLDEDGYRVERSLDGETGWIPVGMTPTDVIAFTDVGVSAETTYFYRVFATNLGGDSPPSAVVTAQTPPEATGGAEDGDGGGAPSPTDGTAAAPAAPAAPDAAAAPAPDAPDAAAAPDAQAAPAAPAP
jgi:Fibronectin type III domain